MNIKWCSNCLLPNTRPNLIFDKNNLCSACKNFKNKKKINWKERKIEFEKIVNSLKSKKRRYDCIIPVSGGKDSTWQTIKCLEYGLNPLAVTWKTPQRTIIGEYNLRNLISLGVDHIDWSVNPYIEKKLTYDCFRKFGAVAIPMHLAMFNIPVVVASIFKIPYVIWGENSAQEYGNLSKKHNAKYLDKEWYKKYSVTQNANVKDWISKKIPENKMSSYLSYNYYNKQNFKPKSIFLGYFFKWDPQKTFLIAKKNGFKSGTKARTGYYNFADLDDYFISIHHWLKWYKFGFTRLFDNLALEIRNKRITKSEAIKIIKKDKLKVPIRDIIKFCEYCNIKKETFFKISEKFRNKKIWTKNRNNKYMIKNFLISDWKW